MTAPSQQHSDELEADLRQYELVKHGSYDKRTEYLNADGYGLFINRLIREDSPYLLQHAHNPVNWFPWGDEAFACARAQNKPVFLSIGYATCHWCHVMEVESFDNPAVAAVLNEHFISVKMDREQYPDIDEIYMTGVQLMTGHGGWPMSNLLLPSGEPFFGATYFPAAQFIAILEQVVVAWRDKREELETSARQMQSGIKKILGDRKAVAELDEGLLPNSLQALLQREDRERGGLAGEPKFPQEPLLLLLLDAAARSGDQHALGFVDRALEGMGRGGIYDQVGGGFARYSVDEDWLVPHFEKMLYNQSQLGLVLLEAYELTRKPFFLRLLTQTLDYVLRDMQRPEGGFYSATDADSEGEEGVFFTWSLAELKEALSADEFALISELYQPTVLGNFEGANILKLSRALETSAKESADPNFYSTLDEVLGKLYHLREKRIHPLRDDKLIVAWSAAMATTLARAGHRLRCERWVEAAARTAQVICAENIDSAGKLSRIALDGTVSIKGQLEDYAALAECLITLFDIAQDEQALVTAQRVVDTMIAEFWDDSSAGFFISPAEQVGPQLTRSKSASDGATLSPVSTALRCLWMLAQRRELLGTESEHDYDSLFRRGFVAVSGQLNEHPLSHPSLLRLDALPSSLVCRPVAYIDGGLGVCRLERVEDKGESRSLELSLSIAEGWHVESGAGTSAQSESRPLTLALEEGSAWRIVEGSHLEARSEPYTGRVELKLEVQASPSIKTNRNQALRLELGVQLCSERECLLPQTILVYG